MASRVHGKTWGANSSDLILGVTPLILIKDGSFVRQSFSAVPKVHKKCSIAKSPLIIQTIKLLGCIKENVKYQPIDDVLSRGLSSALCLQFRVRLLLLLGEGLAWGQWVHPVWARCCLCWTEGSWILVREDEDVPICHRASSMSRCNQYRFFSIPKTIVLSVLLLVPISKFQ